MPIFHVISPVYAQLNTSCILAAITHLPLGKLVVILHTTYWNAFEYSKCFVFWFSNVKRFVSKGPIDKCINFGSGNALVPNMQKPVPEPMLTQLTRHLYDTRGSWVKAIYFCVFKYTLKHVEHHTKRGTMSAQILVIKSLSMYCFEVHFLFPRISNGSKGSYIVECWNKYHCICSRVL